MRAALLFILFFLAHVGRSPAEAYSSGPGSCSALTGHGAGSYASDTGKWRLEHDGGGGSVSPNARVVVRLCDGELCEDVGGCGYLFKGFIFKTSAGTLTVKDATNTQAVSACDGAIGHRNADEKCYVDAYLDLPSTTGTVTVTAEIVQSKMQVSLLTLDIEVVEPWTQVGDDIDGPANYDYLGYSVSMNTDGTRMAVGAPKSDTYVSYGGFVRVYQYDQTTEVWQQMGADIEGTAGSEERGKTVSISGDGTRVASCGTSGRLFMVHEWDLDSQSWVSMSGLPSHGGDTHQWTFAISSDGKRVACFNPVAYMKLTVFEETGGTWSQVGNTPALSGSPWAVALSANGNRVIVGVPDGDYGKVLVYELDSGGTMDWEQMGGVIDGDYGAYYGNFGKSVAISADGSRVVAGAPGWNSGDTAYLYGAEPYVRVYEWSSGSWQQLGSDVILGGNDFFFGHSVDMSDDGSLIAVRALLQGERLSGKSLTLLYSLDSATNQWITTGLMKDEQPGNSYSLDGDIGSTTQVSLSGDGTYVAIGAHLNDDIMTDGGSVRVYKDPSAAAPSPASPVSPSGSCSSSRATGGTVTTSGEYTIHTFTSSGTFEVTDSTLTAVDALVVGGGAGGTGGEITSSGGGGGGGGEVFSASGMIVSKRGYDVTVGDGGNGETVLSSYISATSGGDSEFHGFFAAGGSAPSPHDFGGASGSGKSGGDGDAIYAGGGGAGAGSNGADARNGGDGGNGGDGIQSDITGTATFYGGGGGGCGDPGYRGVGGQGGGGDGYDDIKISSATSGAANTGGGGGGGKFSSSAYSGNAGSGGSGVVILRYESATCSDAGDAAEGGGSQSPSPSTPSPSAQDKKKQAETTRDSILDDISDTRVKAKAKLLADAAIAGVKVQKLSAKITAADADTACSETFSKAGMSAGDGACVATAASSGKRRSLSAMAYDVELMFSASTVNDDALKAAELELKNNGVDGVTSQTSVDPIAELKTVPGLDTSKLQTFETEAAAAATAAAEAQTPPPPTPPPPNLVLDDDDGTVGLIGRAGLLMATAFAILAM